MARSPSSSERARRRASPALLVLLVGARVIAADADSVGPIAIVVGTSSPIRDVTVDGLREVYLRRRRIWPDGTPSLPVNLPADHPVRRAFSKRVLGRLPEDLEGHWKRLGFDGIRPPPVLQSSQAVCAYVAVEPTAIGYLPLSAVDSDSCRVLLRLAEDAGAGSGR